MDQEFQQHFEALVDRSGEHHLWLGAVNRDRGTGRLKVKGQHMTAHRVAWELAYGRLLRSAKVRACPEEPACVRVDHLRCDGGIPPVALVGETEPGRRRARRPTGRARNGTGSMQERAPGVWKLSVTTNPGEEGKQRRVHRTVHVRNASQAAEELARFTSEVRAAPAAAPRGLHNLNLNAAIGRFLIEHLRDEKGREDKTVRDYQALHDKWFAPELGRRSVRDVDRASIDRAFGKMRRAGLSRSRLNQARSLYAPFFRWAVSRGLAWANPMVAFELPTSKFVAAERTPPEVDELCLLLREAVEIVPDVAPVLVLGAVTGMRRGELVGLRRSRIRWKDLRITVDSAIDGQRVKPTKTRKERSFHVDEETIAMLARVCEQQDQLAEASGEALVLDPFLFSLAPDASKPLPPDCLTKRVAILKEHLGIESKSPETIAREDEALRLFRQPPRPRLPGQTGPAPRGGMSLHEIGKQLRRSERWAALAVSSAQRREQAHARGLTLEFDGSILALRKFTSSELLDAGFNVSMVAQRQGHGPQVLTKHYSKSRRSSDRKAAEHLGRVVHGGAAS
jgi:integrase